MKIRLFPAVAGAAGALLLLKAVELSLNAPRTPQTFAENFVRVRGNGEVVPDPTTTGSVPAKKEEKKDEKKPESARPAEPVGQRVNLDKPPPSPGEKALLEKLGERRDALEERQRELDTRENLLKAADKKLEGRINELRELEQKSKEQSPSAAAKENAEQQAIKNLVVMYETMKPKDAARVFDRLDLKVLVPVVNGMNPRKMAEILALMSSEAAERLTVELAMRGLKATAAATPAPTAAALPAGELPAIEPRKN